LGFDVLGALPPPAAIAPPAPVLMAGVTGLGFDVLGALPPPAAIAPPAPVLMEGVGRGFFGGAGCAGAAGGLDATGAAGFEGFCPLLPSSLVTRTTLRSRGVLGSPSVSFSSPEEEDDLLVLVSPCM
jgi:hypothetical protein